MLLYTDNPSTQVDSHLSACYVNCYLAIIKLIYKYVRNK